MTEQEKAFESVKQAVTSAPILRYFSSSEPVEGQGDASANGIGFVLMQNGQPVSYSSRALTTSERNYSQIEKELSLALNVIISMLMAGKLCYDQTINLWKLSTRSPCNSPKRPAEHASEITAI